jgi:hypothetical protein
MNYEAAQVLVDIVNNIPDPESSGTCHARTAWDNAACKSYITVEWGNNLHCQKDLHELQDVSDFIADCYQGTATPDRDLDKV